MGSGATLVSCVETGRNGIGIENETEHFNNAKKRVEEKRKIRVKNKNSVNKP